MSKIENKKPSNLPLLGFCLLKNRLSSDKRFILNIKKAKHFIEND